MLPPGYFIPKHFRYLQHFGILDFARMQLAAEIGQAFTPAVFINKHIEHLLHGIAFGNDNRLDLIDYAYTHNFTTFRDRFIKKSDRFSPNDL